MSILSEFEKVKDCQLSYVMAVNDTMNVLTGKWKLPIIASLLYGKKRFTDLEKSIPDISPRMLSKQLRDMEVNGVVKRTVYDTVPVTVEYSLTESGKSFTKVLDVMVEWGLEHREIVFGKTDEEASES
jgi:DNA-binding HxlR family transcriptional regulator